MATMMENIVDTYYDIMNNKSDPRTRDWFGMGSPFPTMFIVIFYAYFAKVLGPKIMENRKAYSLRKTMLVYNLIQVFISAYLFYEGLASGWFGQYSLLCQDIDYSPAGQRMAEGCYFYYVSKFVELLDTVFFVLRKKNNQVTTLHVIHHGIMPMSVWIGVKFTPGGSSTFFGLLNTFVHIWMYLYYFLAALGPEVQPYLWWKKHLTSLQIIQFVLVLLHELPLLFLDCNYPKWLVVYVACHAILFLFLFRDFYNKAYGSKGKKADVNVAGIEVDPDREGIKQSDLWAHKYAHLKRERLEREGKKEQTPLYADQGRMATGYISDEGLRNRVFIDNNRSTNE